MRRQKRLGRRFSLAVAQHLPSRGNCAGAPRQSQSDGLVMMKARCHNKPARRILFVGDGWRRGAARARNWSAFAEPRSNPSTHERLSARFLEVTAPPFQRRRQRLRQRRGWSTSRRGSGESKGSAAGNGRTIRRGARSSDVPRDAWLGILFHRGARGVALGRAAIHAGR
jgi:hypothetical protein